MKINKQCTQETIECESTDNEYVFVKRNYDVSGNFKKEKHIDINESPIGKRRRYCSSVENAFQFLIENEGYILT